MGSAPSKESPELSKETPVSFSSLDKDEVIKLLDSCVIINGEKIQLRKAEDFVLNFLEKLRVLTPEQIQKILDGEIITLDWNTRKDAKSESKKPTKRFEHNTKDEDSLAHIAIDKRFTTKLGSTSLQCASATKNAIKFSMLSEENKKKIFDSTVSFQGTEVNFGELVNRDEILCEHLSHFQIHELLNGRKKLELFKSPFESEEKVSETHFMEDLNGNPEWSEQIDYDYNEYIKGDSSSSLGEAVDNTGGRKKNDGARGFGGGDSNESAEGGRDASEPPGTPQKTPPGSGGDDGGDGDKRGNKKEEKFESPDEKKEEKPDSVYGINEIRDLTSLIEESQKTKIIILNKPTGLGQTPTLYNVYLHMRCKPETPFSFYLDFNADKKRISEKMKVIKTDSKATILDRLVTLLNEDDLCRFSRGLFETKYKRGHVIFLWDNTEEVADKELLQEIFKEIYENSERVIEPGCQKNVQWIVSSRTFVKEREKNFGCKSYCFVRLSNQKVLEAFDRKVREVTQNAQTSNEIEKKLSEKLEKPNMKIEVKFQTFTPQKVMGVSYAKVALKEDNHYKVLKTLFANLKLDKKADILRRMAVESAVNEIMIKNEIEGLEELNELQKTIALSKKDLRCGAFKFEKSIKGYILDDHINDFLIVDYLRDAIFECNERMNRAQDNGEIQRRLTFLIQIVEKSASVRLTLRDYLLAETPTSLHKEFKRFIEMQLSVFLEVFKNLPPSAKLSILHCVRCDPELYKKFGDDAREYKNDLELFIENETKKKSA